MKFSSLKNRSIAFMLVFLLLFSFVPVSSFANTAGQDESVESVEPIEPFDHTETEVSMMTDVIGYHDLTSGHWAFDTIMFLSGKDLMKGKTAPDENGYGYFGPEDNMTAAEFITVLTRYTHPSGIVQSEATDDGTSRPWYYDHYLTALKDGYILENEYSLDSFNTAVTRQEMALILLRAVENNGEKADETVPNHMIPDIDEADEKYRQAILKLYSKGILCGMDHLGNYHPESTVTRAQASVILHRLIEPSTRKELPLDMRYIVHAGGEIDGYDLTNSMDALENSYQMGNRFIEIDFSYSSDMYHVCIHDWNYELIPGYAPDSGALTKDQFLNSKIYDLFRSMWIDDVAKFMRQHPDMYIITDSKDDNLDLARYISEKHGDLKDRFIIQIYSYDQYDPVSELGFDKIILTIYNLSWEEQIDTASINEFARTHKLAGITFPKNLAYMGNYPALLYASGVKLYTHTEDYPAKWQELFDLGISGVYTNRPPHVN